MSLLSCCASPRKPQQQSRHPVELSPEEIEKLTRQHVELRVLQAQRSSSRSTTYTHRRPPSYHQARSPAPSAGSINRASAALLPLTPHTTGGSTYYSSVVPTHYTGRSAPPSESDYGEYVAAQARRAEMEGAQSWDAKPRPRSIYSTFSAGRSEGGHSENGPGEGERERNWKDDEAEEERRGRQRERRPRSTRTVEEVRWEDLEMPPPAYTPKDRQR